MIGAGLSFAAVAVRGRRAGSIETVDFAAVQADAASAVLGTPDFGGPTLADFTATAGVGGGLWSATSGAVSFDPDGDFAALLLGASSASTLEVTLSDGSKRRLRAPVAGVLELAWAFNGAAMAATGGFVTGWTSETGALGTVTLTPSSATGHAYTGGVEGVAHARNVEAGETLDRTLTEANSVSRFGIYAAFGLLGASSGVLGFAGAADGVRHLTLTYTAPSTLTATLHDGTNTYTCTQTWNGDPIVSIGVSVNSVTSVMALTVSTSASTAATSDTATLTGYTPFDAGVVKFCGALGSRIYGNALASPTAFSAAALETAVEGQAATYHEAKSELTAAGVGSLLVEYPIRLGYLWQDTAMTTRALADGDTVRTVQDVSGTNHLDFAATDAPTLAIVGGEVVLRCPAGASGASRSNISPGQAVHCAFGGNMRNASAANSAAFGMGSLAFSNADVGAWTIFNVVGDAVGSSRLRVHSGPGTARTDTWTRGTDDTIQRHIVTLSREVTAASTTWRLNGVVTTTTPNANNHSGVGNIVTAPLAVGSGGAIDIVGGIALVGGALSAGEITALDTFATARDV